VRSTRSTSRLVDSSASPHRVTAIVTKAGAIRRDDSLAHDDSLAKKSEVLSAARVDPADRHNFSISDLPSVSGQHHAICADGVVVLIKQAFGPRGDT
jgi:hypothetical protein